MSFGVAHRGVVGTDGGTGENLRGTWVGGEKCLVVWGVRNRGVDRSSSCVAQPG